MYVGLCVATIIAGGIFWLIFRRYNATEEEMNSLEDKGEKALPATAVKAGGATTGLHGTGKLGSAQREELGHMERSTGFNTRKV